MEEVGVITRIEKLRAEVEIDPSNACDGCSNKAACHLGEDGQKRKLLARNPINAEIGDLVRVETNPGGAIFSSFLIFIFPLICLVAGYVIGTIYSQFMGIVGAFAGLACGFLLVRLIDSQLGQNKTFQPEITRVLEQDHLQNFE